MVAVCLKLLSASKKDVNFLKYDIEMTDLNSVQGWKCNGGCSLLSFRTERTMY